MFCITGHTYSRRNKKITTRSSFSNFVACVGICSVMQSITITFHGLLEATINKPPQRLGNLLTSCNLDMSYTAVTHLSLARLVFHRLSPCHSGSCSSEPPSPPHQYCPLGCGSLSGVGSATETQQTAGHLQYYATPAMALCTHI